MADAARKGREPIITADGRHNPEAAAAMLGCSTSWLAKRRMDGTGPAWYTLAAKVWYDKEALDRYIAERKQGSSACLSTSAATAPTTNDASTPGTTASKSPERNSGGALAKQVAARRRKLSAPSAQTVRKTPLRLLKGGD